VAIAARVEAQRQRIFDAMGIISCAEVAVPAPHAASRMSIARCEPPASSSTQSVPSWSQTI